MATELCHSGDLASILNKEKKLPETEVRTYSCQIIAALLFLHQNEIIYRDLKAENILIDEYGHVKLSDFGLSTAITDLSKAANFEGTPGYFIPDVLN